MGSPRGADGWHVVPLEYQVQIGAVHACLAVSGELDLATSADLVSQIRCLIEPGRRIAVDIGGVTFIDASGVAACLAVQQQADAIGCAVAFAQPRGLVARVLELLDVEDELLGWMNQS